MSKVSIIVPSYNHEKYVTNAIQSILDQTYQDFELIITDDCSTDKTVEKLKEFNDPRIKLFIHEKNKGIAQTMQNSLDKAKGEYIAYLATDDIYMPDKLEKQVKFLDEHPQIGSVFSNVHVINENGDPFDNKSHILYHIFNQPNKSRFEWLKHFFYSGNCLNAPSQMIRKSCFDDIGFYFDNRYRQLNDFECHVRLCLRYEIFILPDKLVKYRVRDNETNASSNKPDNTIRYGWETYQILKTFLKIASPEEFLKVFPELSNYANIIDKDLMPYFLARLALLRASNPHIMFGLSTLFDTMADPAIIQKLENKCNFTCADLMKLAGKYDVFHSLTGK